MLISPAYAQAAGGEPSFLVSLLPLILIFAVFWFLLIRPQQKRMRDHRAMVEATKKGDEIVTSGGIFGKVSRVIDDNAVEVEIAQNVKVKLLRGTISENLTQQSTPTPSKPANDPGKGNEKKGLMGRLSGR